MQKFLVTFIFKPKLFFLAPNNKIYGSGLTQKSGHKKFLKS